MAKKNGKPPKGEGGNEQAGQFVASDGLEGELVIVADPDAGLQASGGTFTSVKGRDVTALNRFLTDNGVVVQPLFGISEDKLISKVNAVSASSGKNIPDLSIYYLVQDPAGRMDKDKMDGLAGELSNEKPLIAAYVEPPSMPAQSAATPFYVGEQGYLEPGPGGIGAFDAWSNPPGGTGNGVRIIDIEGGWRLDHEDLDHKTVHSICGVQRQGWIQHGTSVLGMLSGERDSFGVTGICPDADISVASAFFYGNYLYENPAAAILAAADELNEGDIMLIELHRPGPKFNFAENPPRKPWQNLGHPGYIPIEWWPQIFAAISYATASGIIVVEAAGNGYENLDDGIYDPGSPNWPFHTRWNPFRRSSVVYDSGSIIVGAGAPPSGMSGNDRSRCKFSNWGQCVDAQGWGYEVLTCGGGDLYGQNEGLSGDRWYTETFNGTSSAAPMIAGALACVQSALRNNGKQVLSSEKARELLRNTGWEQQPGSAGPAPNEPAKPVSQRIGNRPDLAQLIQRALDEQPNETGVSRAGDPDKSDDPGGAPGQGTSVCCDHVTEIIIRCGSPAAVQTLRIESSGNGESGGKQSSSDQSEDGQYSTELGVLLDEESIETLRKIHEHIGDDIEELINKLITEIAFERFAEELKELASELGIKIPD